MSHWQPLAGVRVIDFSGLLPGPFATVIFADLGADVIKIEPPAGDSARAVLPAMYRAANRNKRSLALDLKNTGSAAVIERLARWADVAVESFRPGVAARLGVGHEVLGRHNARLVYCSLSGYGQNGPWRDRPGHDLNYLAAAGGLAYAGQWGKQPARSSLPVADVAGGSFAATAILAALLEARRSGKGARLDIGLLESTLFCAGLRHGLDEDTDARAHLFAANDIFTTADGRFITLGLIEAHFWKNFRTAVGGFAPQLLDTKFDSDASRRQHGDELSQLLHALLRTRTAAQWLELLGGYDLPIELCVTPAAASRSEQILARGNVADRDGEHFLLFPVRADGEGPALRSTAPALGEHSAQILAELAFSAAEIDQLRCSGACPAPA